MTFIESVLTFPLFAGFIIVMLRRDIHYKELKRLVSKSSVIKLEVCLCSVINK